MLKGVEKMKIGKKSYVFGSLVLIVGILGFFLIRVREPIKADDEKYSINIEAINENGKYPVTLSLSEAENVQLKFAYEGINVLKSDELMQGIAEGQRENITIEDTKNANEKLITFKKSVSALKINFLISRLEQSVHGKLTLLDMDNHPLVSATTVFEKESASMESLIPSPLTTAMTRSLTDSDESNEGPVDATPEEIAAANDAANTRFGFNPLVNVKTVTTWTEFESAYNDQTVTKIIMAADITRGSTLNNRQNSLEIDGGGFVLNMTNDTLRLAPTPSDGIGFFHFHDMTAKNSANEGNGTGANMWAFVSGTNGTTYARNWYFRTGNINTVRVNGERVIRLIRGTRAEITVYGKLNLITTSENFYAGSLIIEDGTNWYGEDTGSNYSVIWFEQNSSGTDTGAEKLFKIGKHAQVILKNSTSGAAYPAVYSYYSNLTVGENSVYNSNMTGNSVRFDLAGAQMNVKKGAIVNLLSRGNGSVMQFSANNTTFNLEPEGSIYIVGSTTDPIIDITGGSNRKFIMNSPKGYDIRNRNTGSTSNSPAVSTGTVATNEFTINDSDIDLWTLRSELMGPSQQTYAKVENFTVKARGGSTNVTTTESGLADFVPTQYRRIAGMNSNPEVEWVPVTDADKTYKARVKIGMTPEENFDENGNVVLQPVYAGNGQANVVYTDTFGETHTVSTNDQGYAVMTDTKFNLAGKQMKAQAIRGPWVSEVDPETTVLDITPPEPAKVTGEKVTNATKQLIGENAEPNAKIYIDINGVRQSTVGKVNVDGTWTYNLPQYLEKGDTVQIFLEDNAAEITEELSPAVPATNSASGNINPAEDLTYRDALFKAAAKYTVEDVLPDQPVIEKTVVSSGGTTTQVGDTLTYTLTAKNNKEAAYETVLAKTVIQDSLPSGLTFDPETAEVKMDGEPADFTYDSDSRLLSVQIGDLATGDSVVVTFKAKVASSAVGTIITNTAEMIGESPREKPFVVGAINPEAAHETYRAKSQEAKNPGGTVFGVLELASAPSEIDFGRVKYQGKKTRVNAAAHHGADLVVKDSRANKYGWVLRAKLTTPMTSTNPDIPAYTLVGALKYVYNNREITLNGGAQDIMMQAANAETTETTYNISDTWSESGDGFKFEASAQEVQALGTYQGEILWELGDAP
jgi:fimbrial isopeptide formation D2 family protein